MRATITFITIYFNCHNTYQNLVMPPKGASPTLRERDADRPEYTPLAPPLALHRNRPGDGWQPTRTCAVCGQHINKIDSWAPHMRRLHPYAPRSSKHGVKRVVVCDPTNALGGQTPQRDAYMSTPAFFRGLLAWIASNDGQSPLSAPDPAAFQGLITQARDSLNDAKTRTKVDRHLQGIKIVEGTIHQQANSSQPTLDAMITALEGTYDRIAPLLTLQGPSESYSMISGAMRTLGSFFRSSSGNSNGSELEQGDQNRLLTPPERPDSPRKESQARPEVSQNRLQPRRDPPNFRIARLIRNADKAGGERASEVALQDPNFTVNFGDYLLHLDNNPGAIQSQFRNMAGQEGIVPHRMIQDVDLPWGLPTTIPIVTDGVGIPIAFATEVVRRFTPAGVVNVAQNEAFLVDYITTAVPDQGVNAIRVFRNVINAERLSVTIRDRALNRRCEYPWSLRISAEWIAQRLRISRHEEAEPEEAQLPDDAGSNGGSDSSSSSDSGSDSNSGGRPESPVLPQNKPDNPPSKQNKSTNNSEKPPSHSSSSSNSPSNGSAAQFAAGDLQRILDQDAATLNDLLRRPTVRAHRRYQRAIGVLQTRRAEIMKDASRPIDERKDRDRMRAAYRGLHDQINDQLTTADGIPYKEHDCHEIVSTIIEIVRRFEPEDTPLDAADPDSPIDRFFPYGGGDGGNQIMGNGNTGSSMSQTNIYMGGRGIRSGKIYQTQPVTGKRPRTTGNSRPSGGGGSDDGDDGNGPPPGGKRTKTQDQKLPFRKEYTTKDNVVDIAKKMKGYQALKNEADAAKAKANGWSTQKSSVIDLTKKNTQSNKKNSKDGDYVPPGKSSKQTGPAKSTASKTAPLKKPVTEKPKTGLAKTNVPAKPTAVKLATRAKFAATKPVVPAKPAILFKPVPTKPATVTVSKLLVPAKSTAAKPVTPRKSTSAKPVVLFKPAVPANPATLKAPVKPKKLLPPKKTRAAKANGPAATTTTITSKFISETDRKAAEVEKRLKAAQASVQKKIDDMKKHLDAFPSPPKTSPKTKPKMPSPPVSHTERETRSETKRAADDDEKEGVVKTSTSTGFDKRARKRQRNN